MRSISLQSKIVMQILFKRLITVVSKQKFILLSFRELFQGWELVDKHFTDIL